MEFANRGGQQPVAPPTNTGHSAHAPGKKKARGKWLSAISIILLIAIALLVTALIFSIATTDKKLEGNHVDGSKFQAVFLNGGQVYFGKVRELNKNYLVLDNVYYLRVNQQEQTEEGAASAAQDISLAKLGCELHGPQDQMFINRDQLSFWENLKDDGQVAQAISEFVKQNPEGQKCTDPQS